MYTRTMNIITELRASAGLSQQELAALADITRRYIISLEKGIPNSVPVRVLEVLSEGTGVTPDSIRKEYSKSKEMKIEHYIDLVNDALQLSDRNDIIKMDMTDFRYHLEDLTSLSMTQIKFCEYFGINPAALSIYERGACRTMPKEILEVFIKLGFSLEQAGSINVNTCVQ